MAADGDKPEARVGMTSRRRLGIVVNAPGIQERRACALAPHLSHWFEVDVLVRPSIRRATRSILRWEVVYVIDPGAAGFPAAAIGKGMGRPTVVEVGDPQRQLYAAQGRRKATQHVGGTLDGAVARYADGLVVRGEHLAGMLRVTVPWVTIPDGVDLEQFQPSDRGQAVREGLRIPDRAMVVGVVGSIQWSAERSFAYGLDVIDAVAPLSRKDVHVVIVGDGSGLPRLRERVAEERLDNVHLVGRVPHARVPEYITAMDVCVSTQTRDVIGQARTTAKLPEYLACDRFVLSTDVGTAAQILPSRMLLRSDIADWGDHVSQLRARLVSLVEQQSALRAGAGTRGLAAEHFSYPAIGQRLGQFLETCTRARAGEGTR